VMIFNVILKSNNFESNFCIVLFIGLSLIWLGLHLNTIVHNKM